jgi:hypothetical protein
MGNGKQMNEQEETYRLSMWVCLDEVLKDYGVHLDLTPTVWEHLVNDFMAMLVRQGYAERKEDAED